MSWLLVVPCVSVTMETSQEAVNAFEEQLGDTLSKQGRAILRHLHRCYGVSWTVKQHYDCKLKNTVVRGPFSNLQVIVNVPVREKTETLCWKKGYIPLELINVAVAAALENVQSGVGLYHKCPAYVQGIQGWSTSWKKIQKELQQTCTLDSLPPYAIALYKNEMGAPYEEWAEAVLVSLDSARSTRANITAVHLRHMTDMARHRYATPENRLVHSPLLRRPHWDSADVHAVSLTRFLAPTTYNASAGRGDGALHANCIRFNPTSAIGIAAVRNFSVTTTTIVRALNDQLQRMASKFDKTPPVSFKVEECFQVNVNAPPEYGERAAFFFRAISAPPSSSQGLFDATFFCSDGPMCLSRHLSNFWVEESQQLQIVGPFD